MKNKIQKGISLLEFAIAAPVLFLIIFGLIDTFTYLYLTNIVEARAHRALEVASWVPGLTEEEYLQGEGGGSLENEKFIKAKQQIVNAALEGEISALFSTTIAGYKRASLVGSQDKFSPKLIPSTSQQGGYSYFESVPTSRIEVIIPEVDEGTGNRDIGFARQPIGVRINALLQPLIPVLPAVSVSGEAWGFRENYSSTASVPMFDCLGRPFNPGNLPTPEQCECAGQGINPQTGHCGCPDGKIWDESKRQCVCNVDKIICANGKKVTDSSNSHILIDYDNCNCGQSCALASWKGDRDNFTRRRDSNNECTCKEWTNFNGLPPGLSKDGAGNLVSDPAKAKVTNVNGEQKVCAYQPDECRLLGSFWGGTPHEGSYTADYYTCKRKPECANADICPGGSKFSETFCGCYCTGNHLMDVNSTTPCGCAKTADDAEGKLVQVDPVNNPSNCKCVSKTDGKDLPFIRPEDGMYLSMECKYECKSNYYGGTGVILVDQGDGTKSCECAAGHEKVISSWATHGTDPVMCCSTDLNRVCPNDLPHKNKQVLWHGQCYCACQPGFCRDKNTNECVSLKGTYSEGSNVPSNTVCVS